MVPGSTPFPQMCGRMLADIAREWDCTQVQACNRLQPGGAIYFQMREDDVQRVVGPFHVQPGDGAPGAADGVEVPVAAALEPTDTADGRIGNADRLDRAVADAADRQAADVRRRVEVRHVCLQRVTLFVLRRRDRLQQRRHEVQQRDVTVLEKVAEFGAELPGAGRARDECGADRPRRPDLFDGEVEGDSHALIDPVVRLHVVVDECDPLANGDDELTRLCAGGCDSDDGRVGRRRRRARGRSRRRVPR